MYSKVTYPNFMQSLSVVKVNGMVNMYTIKMVYPIRGGDDPNLLDKVFSSVSRTRKINISYGDWASPSNIYKEEEAIITSVKSDIDFSGSKINYTISCTSSSSLLMSSVCNFPAYENKNPADVMLSVIENPSYGVKEVFSGMKNRTRILNNNLIPGNCKPVKLDAKVGITVPEYFNYLTASMVDIDDTSNGALKDSTYVITSHDDITNEFGGTYFKVTEVSKGTKALNSLDTFEVDVGYPGDNFVTSFTLQDNEAWAMLYDYSQQINIPKYTYNLDSKGNLVETFAPSISKSRQLQYTTEESRTWWSNMTKFPVRGTLTIKGLIRPSILMSYVKLNVYFYGNKHTASGLYIITQQQDTVDVNGYKTVLSITRIGEDA